ncbi:MAG: TIGR03619 family F420-dependent LLM class oxidoreductase, partial [Acidimicrobiales bacterium]
MRTGLHALGIGPGADPAVIEAVARAADVAGFSTLWSGEHVVMVDRPDSPYPYAPDGRIAVPSDADWLDPFVALAFAAAVTSSVRIATGILLLPQHNPVVVAKQAASLDAFSRGRFVLGVGIGWSREEFAALGVPFVGRARRTGEFVEAMRTLWREDVSSYEGESVRFRTVRSYPKPV